MMANFLTPSQVAANYLTILKSIKPSINTNDANSDFVIRGRASSGIWSGLYGDQEKVNNDTWIFSARPEALILFGRDYNIPRQPATAAKSPQVRVNGTNGTVINPGDITFLYVPTGILYSNTTGGTVASGVLDVEVLCEQTGQIGNIKATDVLTVVSPPVGITSTANLLMNMADGSDIESFDSYRARLISRRQNPPAGGNETDYPNFAFEADDSVRSVIIKRFGRGLGTVDVYVTTGTTDVDTAVTQGIPVVRIPSSGTIAIIQAYYDAHVPLTDCAKIYAPIETDVDVTVNVLLAAGLTLSSVPASPVYNPLGLNCQALIEREISRVLYKLPVGGRVLPGGTVGYVTASDIESGLDTWLSAVKDPVSGLFLGKLPILADRQCQPLDPPNVDLALAENSLAAPGVLTVVLGI